MRKLLLSLALVAASLSAARSGTMPQLGTVLPPGYFNIVLNFPPTSYPVLTSACYNAVARWNTVLSSYGVQMRVYPYGTSLPYNHLGQVNLSYMYDPTHAGETTAFPYNQDSIYDYEPGGTNCLAAAQYTKTFTLNLNYFIADNATTDNEYPMSWETDYGFDYKVVLHELGHALGLDHPDGNNVSTISIMNSRVKFLPSDLVAYDIYNIQTLYGYHPTQAQLWQNMVQAATIQNAKTRKNRIDAIHANLTSTASDRYALGYKYPYLMYLSGRYVGYPDSVPAIDGSP